MNKNVEKYRVTFELVNPIDHPVAYCGDRPCIAARDVPDEWWTRVERESFDLDNVRDQFHSLLKMEIEGELIRNQRLEKTTVVQEEWSTL